MRLRLRLLATIVGALALISCAGGEHAYDYGKAKQHYQLHGEVLRLRPEYRIAVIKHEKIEGWMEAMTMEFPVPALSEFSRLKTGTVVNATVNVNESYFWLTDVVVEKP